MILDLKSTAAKKLMDLLTATKQERRESSLLLLHDLLLKHLVMDPLSAIARRFWIFYVLLHGTSGSFERHCMELLDLPSAVAQRSLADEFETSYLQDKGTRISTTKQHKRHHLAGV